jgi:hypothetical protein
MKKAFFISFLLCLFISACAPKLATTPTVTLSVTPSLTLTPTRYVTPTLSPTLTFTPSPTSTPQPPLIEHEWQPDMALILLYERPGDGGGYIPYSIPPFFSLFADGKLFIVRRNEAWRFTVFTKQLSRQEICQHLNTLDQIGFFDYDPVTYQFANGKQFGEGGRGVEVIVNAWKSHHYIYNGLNGYVEDWFNLDMVNPHWRPVILPALRNAYNLFSYYPIENLEIYHPDQLVIRIAQLNRIDSYITSQAVEWPLAYPSLANLFAEGGLLPPNLDQYLIVNNPDATAIDNVLKNSYSDNDFFFEITDGIKKYYSISYRPIIPYEIPEDPFAIIPAPETRKPDFDLRCYPSDGILPIPTPPQ